MQETLLQFLGWEDPPKKGWTIHSIISWASLVAQSVKKNAPSMWEIWVPFLGWEDPLEEGMATLSTILAWRIPMDRGAWWATDHSVTKSWRPMKRLSTAQMSLWS